MVNDDEKELSPLEQRMERWVEHSKLLGFKIKRVLVHPDDFREAPKKFMDYPVETFGMKKLREAA